MNSSHFGFRLSFSILFIVLNYTQLNGDDTTALSKSEELQFTEQISASIYGGWDSHYFTEGRDQLDGGSLMIYDVQASWEFLFSQIWYAASPDQPYDELQLLVGVTQTIENFTAYASCYHLQFPSDNQNDNEVAVGISASGLPAGFQIAVDAYHSFAENGFFTTVSASRKFTISDSLSITGTGEFGTNHGYVSDGHDGANYFALTLVASCAICETISIIARATQNWEINRDSGEPGDETLVDFFNGGIGVQWSY